MLNSSDFSIRLCRWHLVTLPNVTRADPVIRQRSTALIVAMSQLIDNKFAVESKNAGNSRKAMGLWGHPGFGVHTNFLFCPSRSLPHSAWCE